MESIQTSNTQQINNTGKKRKGGIFSLILAILALGLSGFLSLVAHGDSTVTVNGKETDSELATLGGNIFTGWLSMPLIVLAMLLAFIAVLLAFIRLFKNTALGRVLNVLAVVLGGWAMSIAVGLFQYYGDL